MQTSTIFIILGRKLLPNNTPSHILESRVLFSSKIYHATPNSKLLMSGGRVAGTISEAKIMRDLAVQEGVPFDDIIVEDKSTTTIENAAFSLEILKNLQPEKIMIITSDFHMERALKAFKLIYADTFVISGCTDDVVLTKAEREIESKLESKYFANIEGDILNFNNQFKHL